MTIARSSLFLVCLVLMIHLPSSFADQAQVNDSNLDITEPKHRLPAPDFQLKTLEGTSIKLSDFRGKLVILNFWATFCSPCREEMPSLETISQKFKSDGLVVLAIASDRGNIGQVQKFIEDGGYTFSVPLDPDGEVRNAYEVIALPATYIVGRDGKFLGRAYGSRDWSSSTAIQQFENWLSPNSR